MEKTAYIIDGEEKKPTGVSTIEWVDDTFFTVHFLGKNYTGEIISSDLEERKMTVKINHRQFEITKKHVLDDLIKALGLDKQKVKKLHQLASPMPGRILNYAVEVGSEVKEGDALLTLEAMKMENVIKAEGEGVVKNIVVSDLSVVDKGQLLIEFE